MAAGNFEKYKSDGSLGGNALEWLDARFPATSLWKGHLSEYYCPKNFNFWYFFGSLALLVLVIQIVTGIFLVMHYKPDAALNANGVPIAFASVEYIMRDVPGGWLIRRSGNQADQGPTVRQSAVSTGARSRRLE